MKRVFILLTLLVALTIAVIMRNAFTPAGIIKIKKGDTVYLDGKVAGTVVEIHGDIITLDAPK